HHPAPPSPPDATPCDTDTTDTTIPQTPALTLDKSATLNGGSIDYTFTITNTGNVTLHSFTIDDTLLPWNDPPCASADLAPGAFTTCSGSHTVTQADRDTGNV